MVSKKEKLLEKARNSPNGWRRTQLDSLYKGYGFVIESRRRHDIAYHEDFIEDGIRTTLPRHTKVNPVYVKEAVRLIEKLIALQNAD